MAAASPARATRTRLSLRWDLRAGWVWALILALVLFLGFDGGGYDLAVRSDAGVVVWWTLLLGTLSGLLPGGTSRTGRIAVLLLALFAAWSTASTLWSLSSERSLDEASRLAAYVGVLWLAVATFGERERATRHVVGALALAITVIAAGAVLTRLEPNLIPAAGTTGQLLGAARSRLSWPLNYWNALGALMAFGSPLLLSLASSARTVWTRGAAAAAMPLLILCAYLTFSRGAAIAGAVALAVFIMLSPQRIPRAATALLCAAGGTFLALEADNRRAVENGLRGTRASHQGTSLLVLVIIVCLAVGIGQALFSLLARRAIPGRLLTVPIRWARLGTIGLVVLIIVAGLALHGPHQLVHAWNGFKRGVTPSSVVHENSLGRFAALSGEGRYTFWKTGIDALGGRWLHGFGVGTFQLVWLPRAPFSAYIINAHSLYVETLIEVGAIGLALLAGFLVTLFGTAVRTVADADTTARCYAAATAAAILAFLVSAGFDWIWQVPVEPVCFLLLGAAVLAPAGTPERAPGRAFPRLIVRAATIVGALGSLILMGVPMAMTQAVRRSQADARAGHTTAALTAAQTALNIEPGSASSALQVALVLELQHRYAAAVVYAQKATSDEPQNWDAWLVRSRLEAEAGSASQSLADYLRARSLNPRSSLFNS